MHQAIPALARQCTVSATPGPPTLIRLKVRDPHAAYKMTDRVFVYLQRDADDSTRLWVYFFSRLARADAKPHALEFFNELTDQQLRVQLEQQFHDVRTLIVAQAFAEGNLLAPDDEHLDYRTDPHDAGKHR